MKIPHSKLLRATLVTTVLLLTTAGGTYAAQPPVTLGNSDGMVRLGMSLDVFEDTSGMLKITDVSAPAFTGKFSKNTKEVVNFGFSRSAIWVRFTLTNRTHRVQERLLEVDYPLIDRMDLYGEDGRGGFTGEEGGESRGYSGRSIRYINSVFKLSVPPGGSRAYYIRYKDEGAVILPLVLWPADEFISASTMRQYILGIYYGIIAIMIIYNLILFIMVRDIGYIYFVVCVISLLSTMLIKDGYAHQFLQGDPSTWWLNRLLGISVCQAALWMCMFARSFLKTAAHSPLIDMILKSFVLIFFAASASYLLFDFIIVAGAATAMVVIVTVILTIISLILAIARRSRPAYFFLLSVFMLLLGAFLYSLKLFDILPSNIFTEYGLSLGHALQLALLSLGLGDRINVEKRERIRAQEDSLQNEQMAREAQAEAMEYQLQVVEALRESDRLKDEFLANTSHELRTPLNGIIGIAESLIEGAAGDITAAMRENLATIATGGRRLENLINDILDFSKIKNRGLRLNITSVDFRQVTEIVMTLLKPMADAKGIRLINDIPDGTPFVRGDENRLQQVMNNLIGNAVKFTDRGFIRVTAGAPEKHPDDVGESAGDGTGYIEIIVEDTGIGMPEEMLDDIFNPFVQVDSSSSRAFGGTGLGLSITRNLIELHDGKIHAESEEGKGTKMRFTLPSAAEAMPIPATYPQAAVKYEANPHRHHTMESDGPEWKTELRGALATIRRPQELPGSSDDLSFRCLGGSNVLVVDDDPVNLRVMKNMLGIAGVTVRLAGSGHEALDVMHEGYRPDVAVLDVMMPSMNGLELCHRIRERYTITELPVLFLTAKNQVRDLVNGFYAGGNDYITKPFSRNELFARLKTLVLLKNAIEDREQLSVIKNEMDIAKKILEAIIPNRMPAPEGITVCAKYFPFETVGGDFFDFHVMEDGKLGVLLADVSGHGVPASLIASMIKVAFTFTRSRAGDPAAVLNWISDATVDKLGGQFITASYAFIDPAEMRLHNARAGHPSVLVWRESEKKLHEICPPGKIIYPLFPTSRQNENFALEHGDKIIMYSDGIIEVRNPASALYGEEMFRQSIVKYGSLPAEDLAESLLKDINHWTGRTDQFEDDASMIVIEIN